MNIQQNPPNKMELNAALFSLIRLEKMEESAATVISFGNLIPLQNKMVAGMGFRKKGRGDSFTGLTQHGNLTTSPENSTKQVEKIWGVPTERIGQFKMTHPSKDLIAFRHYWASDLITTTHDNESPEEFLLGYNPATLELRFFGIWETRVSQFWIFILTTKKIKILFGEGNADTFSKYELKVNIRF